EPRIHGRRNATLAAMPGVHRNQRSWSLRRRLPQVLAAIALSIFATPVCQIPQDNADGAGMVAHLRGFFRDGDLLYDDDYRALQMSPLFAFVGREGWVSNHWPVGATWLQAPGF